MRKIFTILAFAILLQVSANAQFVRYGGRVGFGASYISDDLLTHSPILGFNIGGYADYMFTDMKNPWADNIYLQVGFNIIRRGSTFQQVFVNEPRSIRQGYYHNWYAQIPVLFGFKYEIPQLPAENFVNFYIGPTLNVGIFGRLWDRQVTPGTPQTSINYDTYITGDKFSRRSFRHMRRFDVGVIVGVGYQWHNLTFDLHLDHGFIALMKKDDVLNSMEINQTGGTVTNTDESGHTTETTIRNRNSYTGTNQAIMFSVGYQLPINRF